jgi:hypothetical protein
MNLQYFRTWYRIARYSTVLDLKLIAITVQIETSGAFAELLSLVANQTYFEYIHYPRIQNRGCSGGFELYVKIQESKISSYSAFKEVLEEKRNWGNCF